MSIHLQLQKTWSASTSSGAASSTTASSSTSLPSVKQLHLSPAFLLLLIHHLLILCLPFLTCPSFISRFFCPSFCQFITCQFFIYRPSSVPHFIIPLPVRQSFASVRPPVNLSSASSCLSIGPSPFYSSSSVNSPSVNSSSISSLSVVPISPSSASPSVTASIDLLSANTPSVDLSPAALSSVTPSFALPVKSTIPQTESPGTVLVTSYETTGLEFIAGLSNHGINLDSIVTSISTYKDGTTGYNITTSAGKQFQILEKPSTYTGPRFTLLRLNGSYSQLSSGIHGVIKHSVISPSVSVSHSSISTSVIPLSVNPSSVNPSSVDSPSVATSSIRNSSSVSPSSILQPVKKSVPQTEIPGTVLATSHEVTLLEFIKELSNYGINLDSPITSISTYKDGTTGYNIIRN